MTLIKTVKTQENTAGNGQVAVEQKDRILVLETAMTTKKRRSSMPSI
jgi:hypothetical protein